MSEPTTTLKKSDFEAEVGSYLGYGRGVTFSEPTWNTYQQNDITAVINTGVRLVYWPKLVNGLQHSWSFLKPTRSLTLTSTHSTVALWDDFGGISEDRVSVTVSGSSIVSLPLQTVTDTAVRLRYAAWPDATGWPQLVSVQPVEGLVATKSTAKQLYVFPTADQDYVISMVVNLRPDVLSNSYPYAYGGPELSELFLASCLAAAELRKMGQKAEHDANYQELLQAAISADRRMQAQTFGRNRDRSDIYHGANRMNRWQQYALGGATVDTTSLTGN